ncbi:hypothetical protein DAI22_01g374100 [Oryza sativa Japonica Group]|nr:hypothetical protein DAI22_01g374100 [Oryza sativa Japonica Group]
MEAAVSQRLGEEVGEGMSRASASRPPPQPPPPASGSGGRLAVLASHLSQSSRTAGEKEAALAAGPSDGPTIFDKILRKEIPSQVVYEDEKVKSLLCYRDNFLIYNVYEKHPFFSLKS